MKLSTAIFSAVMITTIVLLIVLAATHPASATECKSESEGNGYWSWRYIKPYDNKKCWYRGRSMLPKSELHWPEKKMIDPIFPPKRAEVKTVAPDEFNELDAQANNDSFFEPKPAFLWPSIMTLMPFIPWQERIAGALN